MREALVRQNDESAGQLTEHQPNLRYEFQYYPEYHGPPISLALPVQQESYWFDEFPPFFDGLLPEGYQLEALLRRLKIDRNDPFSQLIATGGDLVGSVTVEET
jgi:serine/threonine-protein kinase HipA